MKTKNYGYLSMEITPSSAPVYGGGLVEVEVLGDISIPESARLFFVFDGSRQRQITEAKVLSNGRLQAVIPDHEPPETVGLSLVLKLHGIKECNILAEENFTYFLDQTCYLARYLADSVHDLEALEDWDYIQGAQFSLADEDFPTLDERLTSAFQHLILPPNWNLLGDPASASVPRETLFHFAARLGLSSFVTLLLEKKGSAECLQIRNKHNELAKNIARSKSYDGLADLITDPHAHGVIRWESTHRMTASMVVKRHSFGTITTSTEMQSAGILPLDDEIDLVCKEHPPPPPDKPDHDEDEDLEQIQDELYEVPEELEMTNTTNATWGSEDPQNLSVPPPLPAKPKDLYVDLEGDGGGNSESLDYAEDDSSVYFSPNDYTNSVEYLEEENTHFHTAGDSEEANHAGILGEQLRHLQKINTDIHCIRQKDIARLKQSSPTEAGRLSNSCPNLGQDASFISSDMDYLDEYDSPSAARSRHAIPPGLDVDELDSQYPLGTYNSTEDILHTVPQNRSPIYLAGHDPVLLREIDDAQDDAYNSEDDDASERLEVDDEDEDEEAGGSPVQSRRPHSWHSVENLNEVQPDVIPKQPVYAHKRSQSYQGSEPLVESVEEKTPEERAEEADTVVSPSVRRVRRHNNSTFAVVGPDSMVDMRRALSVSENNNNNSLSMDDSDRRFTISEGVITDPSNFEAEMETSRAKAAITTGFAAKPFVPPRPDAGPATKKLVSRKLSFLHKMRNSTRTKSAGGKGKKAADIKFNPIPKSSSHEDNIADGREKDALRDLPWLTVKNKTKKGNNANSQRPQSMMISKLPTTYGGSLPGNGPYFPSDVGRVHGLPVRQSIARPVTTYETGKNSDSMGDGRSMKSYKDEDSNSLHSGSRTPPHISQFNAISGSVESLDEALDLTELESDADLMIKEEEPEAWSLTVDEKMLKKMDKKDVKRQENIYEFIQKERNFLTTLKIMQKIFARGMSMELQVDSDVIDRMFPQIDEFVDFTSVLVCNLDERQKRGQAVEQIGDVLVEHWSGDNGCRMLWLFSEFCKKQNDIVAGYKDMIKNDKKLLDFTKRCNKNPMTRRRDIPGCILLVTQRITKYPVILKTLIDNSNKKKHKTDCTNLNKALEIVTEIIKKVDKQVLEYEKQQKVKEICQKMESKSYATYKDGRKFLKDDLMLTSRKILQIGSLQWKVNNMKRPTDITLLLFNDVLALLQENNQRFVFPSVGQPAVVPLHKLIVREKAGEDNVLFLISASSSQPEMYELVCQKPSDSKGWMQSIRSAVDECPEEDEGVSHEDVEEQRIMEQKWERAHQLIVDLEKRDRKINELLQEKMEKFKVLVKVVEQPEAMANMKFRYPTYILDDENAKASKLPPGAPILQKAMEQVNKLSHAICGPGGLSRNPSSVGEHESGALPPTSLPKRSETFGGFDNGKEPPSPRSKWAVSLPKLGSKDGVGSSSDESKRDSGLIEGEISNTGDSSANSSPMATVGRAGQGVLVPPTSDQISALAQITHLMNEYMSIATQQDTHIEKMQLKMAHARDKLSYSRRRNGSNLQEAEARRNQAKQSEFEQLLSKREDQLKTEREQWERQYKRFQTSMEKENQELKDKLEKVKRDEIEVQRQQEDVKRAKDEYQRQMARLRELQRKATHTDSTMLHSNSYPSSLSANRNNSNNMVADDDVSYTEEDRVGASLGVPAALSKSHSSLEGELSSGDTGTNSPTYATSGDYPRTFPGVGRREPTNAFQAPQHHHSVQPPAQGTAQQPANLPIHLKYSATNQVTGNMGPLHSDIPSKLLSSSKATNRTSQAIPGKLAKLATSSHQSSQSSAKPTFTDGLKNKLPHFHKKAPRATNSSSELIDSIGKRSNTLSVPNSLKQSKSEANIDAANNRNRSVSSPNPSSSLSPPDNDSALERSNSASSSSSREGSEKGRKKKGKRSSWGSNSDKQPKEEIYL